MIEAEVIQLDRRGVFEPSREVGHEVIYGKTASIFERGMASERCWPTHRGDIRRDGNRRPKIGMASGGRRYFGPYR